MSERTPRDYLLYGALGCALVGTAHAEYTLAVAAHFNEYVALAVPGALDLYVLRALQQRRDVFVAVLAMVAANVTAHLLTAGVLHEHWAITSATGALAPLILWRVYSLKHTRTRQELLWEAPAGAMSAPAPVAHSETYPDEVQVHPNRTCDGCGRTWDQAHSESWWSGSRVCPSASAPDHVPADWMDAEYPETHPSAPHPCPLSEPFLRPLDEECSECGADWGDHPEVMRKRAAHLLKYPDYRDPSAPHLRSVPDLPAEYAPGAVHSESPLQENDLPFLPGAQEYVDQTERPSVRGIRRELKVGQDRAERLLTHLGVKL